MSVLSSLARRRLPCALLAAVSALSLAACAPQASEPEPLPTQAEACDRVREATRGAGAFEPGTTVKVATSFSPQEAQRFEQSLQVFEECTRIDVVQEASDQLESHLRSIEPGVDGSQWSTDLAIVPQPGLVRDLAHEGVIVALPRSVRGNVELGWDRNWEDVGNYEGNAYAAPLLASVKSFVWYSPRAFQEAGYKVPGSWKELEELSAQVVADHPDGQVAPWCLGVADGGASGEALSDWVEEAMLSTQGTAAYDKWARHEVALDSPSGLKALDAVESLVLAEGRVAGGRGAAAGRTLDEAGEQLVQGSCLMLHAPSTYEGHLPEGVTAAPGAGGGAQTPTPGQSAVLDAFPFPTNAPDDPVLVGGDYLVRVASPFDTQEIAGPQQERADKGHGAAVVALMDYLTGADWAQRRVRLGGVVTGHRQVDLSSVSSSVGRQAMRKLQSRQVAIRFDASDSMPSQVGTDSLWRALESWGAGEASGKEALGQAERSWPRPR